MSSRPRASVQAFALSAAFAALSGVALSAGLAVAQEKGAAFDFRDPLTLESYDSAEQRGDYRPRFERELGNANETRNTGALDRSPGAQTGDVNSLSEECRSSRTRSAIADAAPGSPGIDRPRRRTHIQGMIRLAGIAAALVALGGLMSPAAAENGGFSWRWTPPKAETPAVPPRADGERTNVFTRPLPEPPRPDRPHHRPVPPIHFWPHVVFGERRTEAPQREVVVIERPAPAPEPPPEPAPPAPRIDACRAAATPAEDGGGSGLVRFNAPPEPGCPRFARPPTAATAEAPPEAAAEASAATAQ